MMLRAYAIADIGIVAKIWHDSWKATGLGTADDPTVDDYIRRLQGDGAGWQIFVAGLTRQADGFAAFDREQRWLRQLFVHPSKQRSGIGAALLDAVKREMPGGFWLRTDADNISARQFYEKRGLRPDGEAAHPRFGQIIVRYSWP